MAKVTPAHVATLHKYSGLSKKDCRELLGLAGGDMSRAKFMADTTNEVLASVEADRPRQRKRAVDPAFGRITWDGQWEGRSAATTLGKKVRVTVESPDGQLPDERQRSAYRQFLRLERKLASKVRAAHLQYYRKARRLWARQMENGFLDELAPPVASADEVVARLEAPMVHVPRQPRRGWETHLQWECAWDPEHGHQVTLRNAVVRYAGPQGG